MPGLIRPGFLHQNSNLSKTVRLTKFAITTDGNGSNAWLGIDITSAGVTGKKLQAYPCIIATVSECTDSSFYITNVRRENDTYITVLFNKALASSFSVNLQFLVE